MHHLSLKHFPFTAIVGQKRLKMALILNAINPKIGGVLIKGAKGTAKSTAARALAEVLPSIEVVKDCPFNSHPSIKQLMADDVLHRFESGETLTTREIDAPFVTLPLSATEDRVAGTIDVSKALATGEVNLKPGLLAEAHRGILYVDEVNLLDDHLVNILLDAAAMGRNIVEREGVSAVHPARFILIGTMNPEEGELRPQLLDRFGIAIEVESLHDLDERVEIMRRLDLWDRDAHALEHEFERAQRDLCERIRQAMGCLPGIAVTAETMRGAAERSLAANVDGHRADLAMIKVAVTLAAWYGDETVKEKHLDEAATFVLAHRQRKRPFENPPKPMRNQRKPPELSESGNENKSSIPQNEEPQEIRLNARLPEAHAKGTLGGKQGISNGNGARGKKLGVKPRTRDDEPVDVAGSLIGAAVRQGSERGTAHPHVTKDDLKSARMAPESKRAICFVVDASGSMGAHNRLKAVHQAARQLLEQSYQGRHHVALVTAGGEAKLTTPLTRDAERVDRDIQAVEPSGKTPLAAALVLAGEQVKQFKNKGFAAALVMLTDGRANEALETGGDPVADALRVAASLSETGVDALIVDTENDFINIGLGRDLAEALGAEYIQVETPEAEAIVNWIGTGR